MKKYTASREQCVREEMERLKAMVLEEKQRNNWDEARKLQRLLDGIAQRELLKPAPKKKITQPTLFEIRRQQ
jgi:uncharacterized Fe-S cluster-containing protein